MNNAARQKYSKPDARASQFLVAQSEIKRALFLLPDDDVTDNLA